MKKKILLSVFLLFSGVQNFAQSRRVADRYFDDFAYIKAAKLYESIYKKGDTSKYIIKKLGDSYYNNAETDKAEYWYHKLVNNYKDLTSNYLFKYAQVLRSNGKYSESDSLFLVLASTDKLNNRGVELQEQNYLLNYLNNKNQRISVRNLALNTPFSDFGGFMLKDEVYFASTSPKSSKKQLKYRWNNQPFLNVYKAYSYIAPLEGSEKDSVLELSYKQILPSSINTKYHESNPIFTKDGKTMYFTRVNYNGRKLLKDEKETVNLKLFKAELINGKWSNVVELPFNNDNYSVGHAALSVDEKMLYFVSDMPGGYGKSDLYKVEIKTNNEYGKPINLGETVNTSDKEMFPFIGSDNTLYFSSNGHLGLGLQDIFQTKIKDDGSYTKVVNLGYPFNSNRDDFSFFVDATGKKGFFSSNREKGKGDDDIYSFIIYEDIKKEKPKPVEPLPCTQLITGTVKNIKTKEPIASAVINLLDDKGEVVSEVLSNKSGIYKFEDLPCGENKYAILANKLDHKPDRRTVFTNSEVNKVIKSDLNLTPLIVGDQIVINPIYFNYDKATIRVDAQFELEDVVTVMNNHPNMKIKIESHTDSRGNKEYNRKLSDKRAKSTRNYIISRGIAADRITSAIGYGESQLLNDCDDKNRLKCTEEEHQLNRRSYFYIVSGGENVNVEDKKPTIIDNSYFKKRKKLIKTKIKSRSNLLQLLNEFNKRRSRSDEKNKCVRDENTCDE